MRLLETLGNLLVTPIYAAFRLFNPTPEYDKDRERYACRPASMTVLGGTVNDAQLDGIRSKDSWGDAR